jgi:hypothetical protein
VARRVSSARLGKQVTLTIGSRLVVFYRCASQDNTSPGEHSMDGAESDIARRWFSCSALVQMTF